MDRAFSHWFLFCQTLVLRAALSPHLHGRSAEPRGAARSFAWLSWVRAKPSPFLPTKEGGEGREEEEGFGSITPLLSETPLPMIPPYPITLPQWGGGSHKGGCVGGSGAECRGVIQGFKPRNWFRRILSPFVPRWPREKRSDAAFLSRFAYLKMARKIFRARADSRPLPSDTWRPATNNCSTRPCS